jgi:hypothetical protein
LTNVVVKRLLIHKLRNTVLHEDRGSPNTNANGTVLDNVTISSGKRSRRMKRRRRRINTRTKIRFAGAVEFDPW